MSINSNNNKNLPTSRPVFGPGTQPVLAPRVKYTASYKMGNSVVGSGVSAAREVASAKKTSARKNTTINNFIMFVRMEVRRRRYERILRMRSNRGQL